MNTIQFLMMIVNWLQADPSHIVVTASALAALTPTPDASTTAGKIYKVLDLLALNFLHAKDSGVNTADLETQVLAILAKQKPAQPPAA
jgi:hypothetical protein